jgi:hypothetical protein
VPDEVDACKLEPEDRDGNADDDGCPDVDDDGDGVPDTADKCPTQAEDHDGWLDEDGCFDGDDDRDGVPDAHDRCPEAPETIRTPEDREADGCPDGRAMAEARPDGSIWLSPAAQAELKADRTPIGSPWPSRAPPCGPAGTRRRATRWWSPSPAISRSGRRSRRSAARGWCACSPPRDVARARRGDRPSARGGYSCHPGGARGRPGGHPQGQVMEMIGCATNLIRRRRRAKLSGWPRCGDRIASCWRATAG